MVITNCYSAFMEPTTPFGAALRYYRKKERSLTQKKFAKKIGISQAMLSKIELGLEDGSAKTREFITNYFNIPYSTFLETGRKRMPTYNGDEQLSPQTPRPQIESPPIYIKEITRLNRENKLLSKMIGMLEDENMRLKAENAELKRGSGGKPLGGALMPRNKAG